MLEDLAGRLQDPIQVLACQGFLRPIHKRVEFGSGQQRPLLPGIR